MVKPEEEGLDCQVVHRRVGFFAELPRHPIVEDPQDTDPMERF
jgi:hypothetical protein